MSTSKKLELQHLMEEVARLNYQPIGIIFYDDKTKLLGIAPLSGIPDAFVEKIGEKLGGKDSTTIWQSLTRQ